MVLLPPSLELTIERNGGRVKGWGTVRGLSHPVHEFMECLHIFGFGLKGPTMDSTRVLCLRGGSVAGLFALRQDLDHVGVGSGFVHAVILQGQQAGSGGSVPPVLVSTAP